jgi:hypothetical protein
MTSTRLQCGRQGPDKGAQNLNEHLLGQIILCLVDPLVLQSQVATGIWTGACYFACYFAPQAQALHDAPDQLFATCPALRWNLFFCQPRLMMGSTVS